ncbi:putative serine/threonine kinase [Encephalitozoon hellem ATCC 50504]|uniref:Ser/Thr protein kinase n=1 Tax=Encephalitozoon hellem TaxID=27973 RepID=A0A9Q9CC07_ENCHE|nr:putative serine/threonine kinase [Encephalitozoon hellem ATCC 50504]AFM98281.1 putative serine/threonine kinase [Encephalitozoon hellem ATCC 50504]UTX43159.1 Ser/Thr protein kinase [Encephalitozoon hellem]|eukprot:XP_003887262.1 putative serine/threonine kinase [Encephalitozoon hellem ATCC 50504]
MSRKDAEETLMGSLAEKIIDAEKIVARSELADKQAGVFEGKEKSNEENGLRYKKLQTILGEGTFKKVYKAIDQEEGKEVAWNEIKIGENGQDGKERTLFSNEIGLLKSISHPNILRILDYWFTSDSFIFITELMSGGTLRQYIAEIGDLNVKLIKKWGRSILEGLVYLHGQSPPIIHRDIKCENIFVNAALGEVKIGDLGVAKERRMKRYTVVGTPQFMAREMFEGEGYCEKIDVYAFGMCLIEMATGAYPYKECTTAAEVYKAIIQGVPPVALNSIKDICLRNLIMNCLVSEKDRLGSAECLKHHFFDSNNTCNGECIPAECMSGVPLTAPANDMEISFLSFKDNVITFQLFFMSMARFIKFDYNLEADTVEDVTNEMLEEEVVSEDQRDTLLRLLSRGIEKAKERIMEVESRGAEEVMRKLCMDGEKGKADGPRNDFNKITDRNLSMEEVESMLEIDVKAGGGEVSTSQGTLRSGGSESQRVGTEAPHSPLVSSVELPSGDGVIEEQRRITGGKCPDESECPNRKYDEDVSIEEFVADVSAATKRSSETATNWIKTFKSNDIDSVFELKILVDEDWDKLGLTVFSSRAMKNMLYGLDKIPLKEKQLPTNTSIKDYEGRVEIKEFLREIGVMVGKEKCVSIWESKLLAQDIRTVEELRSLHQDDWDRLGLSVYSCRVIKNVIYKKGRIVFC